MNFVAFQLLESKWVSSSKEIITFRKALLNPVTSVQFRRYVSIKGDTLENNVLFWLEVQKFKVGSIMWRDYTVMLELENSVPGFKCFTKRLSDTICTSLKTP